LSSIPFLFHLPPDFLIPRGTEPTPKSSAVPSLFPLDLRVALSRARTPSVSDRLRDQRRDPGADPSLPLSFFSFLSPLFFPFLFFFHFFFSLFSSFPSPSLSFLLPRALDPSSLSAPERRPAVLPLPRSTPVGLAPLPPFFSLSFPARLPSPDLAPRPRARPCPACQPRAHDSARHAAATWPLLPRSPCPRRVSSTAEALTRTRTTSPQRTAPATVAQCRLWWSPPRVISPPTGAIDEAQRRWSSRRITSSPCVDARTEPS